MEEVPQIPNLVASTGEAYCTTVAISRIRQDNEQDPSTHSTTSNSSGIEDLELNYFKSAQWTPDGTTLLTSSADNTIRSFILPTDLLSDPSSIKAIIPYTKHTYPTSINCIAPYPLYDLSDATTTLHLSTPTNLPIRLTNTLSPSATAISTYNLISPTTEEYHTPASILWSSPGHFLTGTDCLISLFDVSRNGEGPMTKMPTIPSKRHIMKGGGVGIRGIVSALSQQYAEDGLGMIAAGTWTRSIGLYDAGGMGGTVSVWNIAEAADTIAGIHGTGITQTVWSPCGRYLCVVERRSKGVLVYDVRVMGKLVSWLVGRDADTNQRLGVDIFTAEKGMEVWGGDVDGLVKVWEAVGLTEGALERAWEWRAHDDPVGSTAMHPSGSVVATCSGQRGSPGLNQGNESDSDSDSDDDASDEESVISTAVRTPDNTLKVWSI